MYFMSNEMNDKFGGFHNDINVIKIRIINKIK